jgi:hypothetical protein
MRLFPAFFCLLAATACGGSPAGPTASLNEQYTLSPGQTSSIHGTRTRVQFIGVSGDSRCPADAICVHAGDAIVQARVFEDGAADYELHTNDARRAFAIHRDLRIELKHLQPYPFSSRRIEPSDYRATLLVER